MKIILNSKIVLKAVQSVGALIKSPNTIPILDNVRFHIQNKKLQLTADNLEVRSTVELPIPSDETLTTCIGYDFLTKVLKGLPDTSLEFEFGEKSVKLTYPNGDYSLPLVNAAEFPVPAQHEVFGVAKVDALDFAEALKKATTFVAVNDLTSLGGILVSFSQDSIKVVGGSTHVIVESTIGGKCDDHKLLLSKTSVAYMLSKLIEDEELELSWTKTSLFIKSDGIDISATLLDMTYPAYEKLFELNVCDKTYQVDKDSLLPAVRRMMSVSEKFAPVVRFKWEDSLLRMSYKNPDYNVSANESIKAEFDGGDFLVGFQPTYVNSLISLCSDDTKMMFSEPGRACIVSSEGMRALLMPFGLMEHKPIESKETAAI